jgi:hypothetical protein
MNRAQKIALYNLIVIVATLTIVGAAVGILYILYGMPKALGGVGLVVISFVMGLSPILFRKKRGQSSFDERDLLISRKATIAAYFTSWVFFTAACMVPWLVLECGATIRVVLLPCILVGGTFVFIFVHSIAILVQYGLGGKGEKS